MYKDKYAKRGYKKDQIRSIAFSERTIDQSVNGNTKNSGKGRGKEERDDRIYAKRYGKAVGTISASRIDNAVREVKKSDCFIDNGKAEGNEGINAASDNTV